MSTSRYIISCTYHTAGIFKCWNFNQQCVKSKSNPNLAEAAADPALDAAGNPLPLVPTTEGPLGPVIVGLAEATLNVQAAAVIDVEAIEAGVDIEELGAVGGIDLNAPHPVAPNELYPSVAPPKDEFWEESQRHPPPFFIDPSVWDRRKRHFLPLLLAHVYTCVGASALILLLLYFSFLSFSIFLCILSLFFGFHM